MKKMNKWLSSIVFVSLLSSSSALYADGDDPLGYLWGGLKTFFYSACTAAGGRFGWEGGKDLYRWAKENKLLVGVGVGTIITLAVLKRMYDEQKRKKQNDKQSDKEIFVRLG